MKNKKRFSVLALGIVSAIAMIATGILHFGAFTGRSIMVQAAQQTSVSIYDGTGEGTMSSPFLVGSQDTLHTLVRANAGVVGTHFRLIDDIYLTGNWAPIANLAATSVFNGNHFTINGMTISAIGNSGLFTNVAGTVRNLNFSDVHMMGTSTTRGTVAGTLLNGALIENVRVESGTFDGGSQTGGIAGIAAAGATVTIRNVYNAANITGNGNNGGILGRASGANMNVTIESAFNSGNIHGGGFTGGILGYTNGTNSHVTITQSKNSGEIRGSWNGGIIGEVAAGVIATVDWSINTGRIYGRAGIVGSAWNGTTVITNSINNSVVIGSNELATSRNSGIVTIENTWVNTTLTPSGRLINNQTNTTISHSGIFASENMVQVINNMHQHAGMTDDIFIIRNGQITLNSVEYGHVITYVFVPGDGEGERFLVRQSPTDLIITLPDATTEGFNVPTKVGYSFDGWSLNNVPVAGLTFHNEHSARDLVFTARFREAIFYVDVQGYGNPTVIGGNVIYLGQSGTIELSNVGHMGANRQWHVLMGESASNTNLGSDEIVNLSTRFDIPFIADHAIMYNTPVNISGAGNVDGRIVIRVVDLTSSTAMDVNLTEGGTFTIQVDTRAPISVIREGRISIQRITGQNNLVTNITAIPDDHFRVESIRIFNAANNQESFIENETTLLLSNTLADMQNFRIEVNFEPIPYAFDIFATIVGEYGSRLNNAFEVNVEDVIEIGQDATVNVTANQFVGAYRFVAWKIMRADGSLSRQPTGALNFTRTFESIDGAILDRYLQEAEGTIVIIAEFAPTHQLSINVSAVQSDFGTIVVTVIDPIEGTGDFGNINGMTVSHGSTVIIYARPNPNGLFDLLLISGLPTGVTPVEGRVEFTMTDRRDIEVVFVEREFDIVFQGRENVVNTVDGVTGFVANVVNNDGASTEVLHLGSTISSVVAGAGSEKENYRFVNFTIIGLDGRPMVIDGTQDITLELLIANLRFVEGIRSFVITANYVRTFTLDVRFAAGTEGMGIIRVYRVVGADEIYEPTRSIFDEGTRIVVSAVPFNFHSLVSIGGTTTTDITNGRGEITSLRTQATVTVRFESDVFDVVTTLDNQIMASRTEGLTVGSVIELSVTPPGGREVTSWTLNGRDIDSINGVVRRGNTAEITLTVSMLEWLETNGEFRITSAVEFGLTTGVLMAIVVPSILIPILLGFAIFYTVRSRKKYATIKAELVAANRHKATFDQASMIQDLKDGKNVGQVRDADVKREMKERKKKDK